MSDQIQKPEQKNENILANSGKELMQPFIDLFHAPRALWGVNLSYLLEGLAYFGVVGLLAMYFNEYVGLDDIDAGRMVGLLTGGITIAMLVLGATVDFVGVRKAMLAALSFMLFGRVILALNPSVMTDTGLGSHTHWFAMLGLFGIVIGYGIYQPAAYAAVKRFTNEKTSAMGYAMLYAIMNLGGFLPGLISPPIRQEYGISGVFWVFSALTVVGMLVVAVILTKKVIREATLTDLDVKTTEKKEEKKPLKERLWSYIKRFPIRDGRFMFFIFILIPVQTLFAHNWLTLPQYCERAFSGIVSEQFELFVNFNPILIFILTPLVAAATMKKNTYGMMIWGTLVMGLAPFILVMGANIWILLAYLLVLTVGEAMWQPRFLQWVAEIAPKDMTGIYMGLGQFPWFLTKVLTSIYSGWFLMNYCPKDMPLGDMDTESMWLIYGGIAIITPIALVFARKWMMKGFITKSED